MPPTAEDQKFSVVQKHVTHCCMPSVVTDEASGPRLYTRLVVLKLWLAELYGPRVLARGTPAIIFSSSYVLEGNMVNI